LKKNNNNYKNNRRFKNNKNFLNTVSSQRIGNVKILNNSNNNINKPLFNINNEEFKMNYKEKEIINLNLILLMEVK